LLISELAAAKTRARSRAGGCHVAGLWLDSSSVAASPTSKSLISSWTSAKKTLCAPSMMHDEPRSFAIPPSWNHAFASNDTLRQFGALHESYD